MLDIYEIICGACLFKNQFYFIDKTPIGHFLKHWSRNFTYTFRRKRFLFVTKFIHSRNLSRFNRLPDNNLIHYNIFPSISALQKYFYEQLTDLTFFLKKVQEL